MTSTRGVFGSPNLESSFKWYKLSPRGSDPQRKTTTRTIRIAQRYDEALKEESERRGLSFNALMDRIHQRYVEAQRFFEG